MNGRIWYCVNRIGMATACNDEKDALETAEEAEKDWPHMAPHRVMRLVDAAELDELRTENARLLAELEAVGAGGVQPLAPQQAAPVPPQKPELRAGQIWRTRGGDVVEVVGQKAGRPYPFRVSYLGRTWAVDKDGKRFAEFESEADLIELISDVPQEGGEA